MKNEKAEKKDKKKKGKKKAAQAAEKPVEKAAKKAAAAAAASEDGMDKALQLVSGKWKLRVVWALRSGEELRYSEVKRQVAGITDVMLSQSLRELAEDGMVERKQYGDLPPRVSYIITEKASGLLPALEAMARWGETV